MNGSFLAASAEGSMLPMPTVTKPRVSTYMFSV
jgi:hypothetical protein